MADARHAEVSANRFDWDGSPIPEGLRLALCRWLEMHGIDPNSVPLRCYVERRPGARQVGYLAIKRTPDGGHVIWHGDEVLTEDRYVQLEAPPMPWPDIVTRPDDWGTPA